ncbi:unnamed protein product [Caenorhabditis auriculariae]|uniref:Structural maintenance of chromosomes protein 5 n=1 Tax=Caenorhabditis auriculariae TaxID=2777116 RepID=A0A8S1HM48_9PELO|nr:unnamed protein product [Caenorhabditis auriculariae]
MPTIANDDLSQEDPGGTSTQTSRKEDLPSDFPDGSILQVKLHNFLTYENVICRTTKNLNLIIGYNGSGKSSLICGICLALGGSPKLLGRSEKIGDYIRHGCTEGSVEVVLADEKRGPQSMKIYIQFKKCPVFYMNGKLSTQSSIRERCREYNIQIDNPCAFLAQDKVKSFSEQSAIDLLINTQKAASIELLEQHEKMKQTRQESQNLETKFESFEENISRLQGEITALQPRLDNYRKRIAMEDRLRLLEKRAATKGYEHALAESESFSDDLKKRKKSMEAQQAKVNRMKNDTAAAKVQLEGLEAAIKKAKSATKLLRDQLDNQMDFNAIKSQLRDAKANYEAQVKKMENFSTNEKNYIKAIESLQQKLDTNSAQMNGYDDFMKRYDEVKIKLNAEKNALSNVEDEISKKKRKMDEFRTKIQEEEERTRYTAQERLRMVERISRGAVASWQWYQQNRDRFREPVYLPLMHIVLKDRSYTPFVEDVIPTRDLCMFICGCKEDEMLLQENGTGLSTSVVPRSSVNKDVINAKLPEDLKRNEFVCLVSEMFDAPGPLKQYICNITGVHKIPMGTANERTMQNAVEAATKAGFWKIFTSNLKVTLTRSKYSGETIQKQQNLYRSGIFSANAFLAGVESSAAKNRYDPEIKALNSERERIIGDYKARHSVYSKEDEEINQERSRWREKSEFIKILKKSLENEEERLDNLRNNVPDVDAAKEAYEEQKRLSAQDAHKKISHLEKDLERQKEIVVLKLYQREHQNLLNSTLLEVENELISLQDAQQVCVYASRDLELANDRLKVKEDLLFEKCGFRSLKKTALKPDQIKKFDLMMKEFEEKQVPDDFEELEEAMSKERAKIRIADDSSEGSADDERRMMWLKESLQQEEEGLRNNANVKKNIEKDLAEAIEKWRVPIDDMIGKINESYVKFFQQLGCDGEVHLEVPENKLDIHLYGIMIMVSFRKGERMKRLDQRVQSGGERSVSTMLYLLALQQLCPVPFRCVDEINQGMDPTNEKKVFDIMVETLSSAGQLAKTQYFLLTPKLLRGLNLTEKVSVLVVHNLIPKNDLRVSNFVKSLEDSRAR